MLLALAVAETFPFVTRQSGEVVADLEMSSPGSDWGVAGREAALATVTVDDRATQHVMVWSGEARHTYSVFLGAWPAGRHRLAIERHSGYSAPQSRLQVHGARFRELPADDPISFAPVLFARADTVGGFSDVPLIAYCERLPEGVLQYTVIFSNEDGGTSTRALMARWGRTTDIEYIYRLRTSKNLATIQAKDHQEVEFRGRRDGRHPLLIPSTKNNMVSGEGESPIRYQLAPVVVDLTHSSREQLMDDQPISYRVAAQELRREDKLRPFGTVDGERISDPRNYLYLEAKVSNQHSAVAAAARVKGEDFWRFGHLGRADYAISRDGWVRTTIELP
ncbi:MAG: hypothetical protein HYR60_08300, partial [Acidobacteria bacterium]|nr:hypothetical protein [Acidobacteriota bacterium]